MSRQPTSPLPAGPEKLDVPPHKNCWTFVTEEAEEAEGQAGSVYVRRIYEIMRYWDDEHPEWNAEERAFSAAWRKQPKWVVSHP